MYKVAVTDGGTTATVLCKSRDEAMSVKERFLKLFKTPIEIEITATGKRRTSRPIGRSK